MVATEYVVGEVRELKGLSKARVREDGTLECFYCNEGQKDSDEGYATEQAVVMHWNRWCKQNPAQKAAETNFKNAARKNRNDAEGVHVTSRRGRRRLNLDRAPDPMDEVPERPGGARGGPSAYFIRPGATISEALIVSPNGAPVMRGGRDRANGRYYQERLKDKGFEYIGPSLTPQGVKRLAEVIAAERQDYILFLEEEIDLTDQTIREADKPEVRDQARTRRGQLERQRSFYAKPLDVPQFLSDLEDILKAQKLAALSQEQREAMQILLDETVSARVGQLVDRMSRKRVTSSDGALSVEITNASADDEF